MKFALLSSIVFFFSACTTITSKHQYIAVDSTPRHASVFDENDNFLGKTPFVYEITRDSKLHLFIEKDGIKQNYNNACSFRWGEAGLGNLIFLYFAAIAIPIDLTTGAAYNCEELNKFDLQLTKPSKDEFCARYIVLPVKHHKFNVSSELERKARQIFSKTLKSCESIVELNESDALFASLGITNSTKNRDFTQDFYNIWAYETGANRVIDFEFDENEEEDPKISIHPVSTDLYTHEKKAEAPFSIEKKELKAFNSSSINWGAIAAAFIPNAITAGFGRSNPTFLTHNPYSVTNVTQRGLTNSYFLQLSSVNSLSSLSQWGLDYGFGVSYPFFLDTFKVEIENTQTKESTLETWKIFQLSTNFFTEGFLHTPIGAFSLKLGFAPTYHYAKTPGKSSQQSVDIGAVIALVYRFFIERSFFGNIEILSATGPTIKDEKISGCTLVQANFGLGYILPLRVHHFLVEKF